MFARALSVAAGLGVGVVTLSAAWGQSPPTSAKVDTVPLDLTPPDRYAVAGLLEPVRKVTLVATADGVVRSQSARAGADVRDGAEVAALDRAEAGARLKIAQAEQKECEAVLVAAQEAAKAPGAGLPVPVARARVDAAQARVELAQIALDRCTLRAPFAGKILDTPVSDGQYVPKGTVLAELADVSSLRVLVPTPRAGVSPGASLTLDVEGEPVQGKVQALLPLPESMAVLRELASPVAAAWVVVPNASGALEPGRRVLNPAMPDAPVAVVPASAVKKSDDKDGGAVVQVIRNEYVTNLKVRVLGSPGPDRTQVSGTFRPTDALIVAASVPLLPGTLVRFNPGEAGGIEATAPNPAARGASADLVSPRGGSRTAPIGAPGSAAPKGKGSAKGTTPAGKSATKEGTSGPY